MLTIENIQNIDGKEFQLSSGRKFIIGIARAYYDHYSFGVFPLMENNVASIKDGIVYKQNVYVKPENLTLKNFILELHIQTGMICSQ